ncbi:ECF transporter S component [archaeon]|nr:MAG: ECF transporter S component [archaeon]
METRDIAIRAAFTALVFIATAVIPPLPIAASGGYLNFGDTAVYITALLFGSYTGAFAGGVGSALADLFLGFGAFAPVTLIVKGTEGFVVGYLGKSAGTTTRIIALALGGVVLVAGYFVFEVAMFGYPAAIGEVPFNMLQFAVGAMIAIAVVRTVESRLNIDTTDDGPRP